MAALGFISAGTAIYAIIGRNSDKAKTLSVSDTPEFLDKQYAGAIEKEKTSDGTAGYAITVNGRSWFVPISAVTPIF